METPMRHESLITATDSGLFCEAGGFFIDPWNPVDRALITHAHGDHARPGSARYLTTEEGAALLQYRLGTDARIDSIPHGKPMRIGRVSVSFHPAGHILGSAQIRIERKGDVCVVSGDYKLAADRTCRPFEPVQCDEFISECTFGVPVFRWPPQERVFDEINAWWCSNIESGRTSVLFAYALGKAQRVLAGVDDSIGPIGAHGVMLPLIDLYRKAGVELPPVLAVDEQTQKVLRGRGLVIAPPSARGSPWLRRFGDQSAAFASGWMRVRGARRRRTVDRGFVISDHADWDALHEAIRATGAQRIGFTHGSVDVMARRFRELGFETAIYPTHFEGELELAPDTQAASTDDA